MKNTIKLGLSGAPGSFSEEAALLYAEREGLKSDLKYLIDMEGVLAALTRGEIDKGIFPVVNNQGGLVKQAFQAMGKYLFKLFLCLADDIAVMIKDHTPAAGSALVKGKNEMG